MLDSNIIALVGFYINNITKHPKKPIKMMILNTQTDNIFLFESKYDKEIGAYQIIDYERNSLAISNENMLYDYKSGFSIHIQQEGFVFRFLVCPSNQFFIGTLRGDILNINGSEDVYVLECKKYE